MQYLASVSVLYEDGEFIEMNTHIRSASGHRSAASIGARSDPRRRRRLPVTAEIDHRHRMPHQCGKSDDFRPRPARCNIITGASRSDHSAVYQDYVIPPITTPWSAS